MNYIPYKIIAVDFDGTLVVDKYPFIGAPILENIDNLKMEQAVGAKIILWTCRCGEPLKEAVNFCKMWNIILDGVNENLQEMINFHHGDSRKIFATEYWDDKAVNMKKIF